MQTIGSKGDINHERGRVRTPGLWAPLEVPPFRGEWGLHLPPREIPFRDSVARAVLPGEGGGEGGRYKNFLFPYLPSSGNCFSPLMS